MQNYIINIALEKSQKSMARDHKHGAVCVIGGRIASTGFNYPTEAHSIKVREKGDYL